MLCLTRRKGALIQVGQERLEIVDVYRGGCTLRISSDDSEDEDRVVELLTRQQLHLAEGFVILHKVNDGLKHEGWSTVRGKTDRVKLAISAPKEVPIR